MNAKQIAIIFLSNIIVGLSIIFWFLYFQEEKYIVSEVRENSQYEFINPLLECNINFNYYNPNNVSQKIEKYITEQIEWKNIADIGYYVRLLKNGATFGYNQDAEFVPASLIKVPLWIAVLKNISMYDLDEEVMLDFENFESQQRNFWQDKLKNNSTYTLRDMISQMLINSDNIAATGFLSYIWIDKIYNVYNHFWLKNLDFEQDDSVKISPKNYASFFRVLYNASYLSREESEYMLGLLAQSNFKIWLRWLLPDAVKIANKFWERHILDTWEKQIHDCGIVFLEKQPYVICIMTKWNDFDKQIKIIQNISKIVYDEIKILK